MILSGVGLATMWAAVFADVGVTFLAVLNSFRTLRVKKFYTGMKNQQIRRAITLDID